MIRNPNILDYQLLENIFQNPSCLSSQSNSYQGPKYNIYKKDGKIVVSKEREEFKENINININLNQDLGYLNSSPKDLSEDDDNNEQMKNIMRNLSDKKFLDTVTQNSQIIDPSYCKNYISSIKNQNHSSKDKTFQKSLRHQRTLVQVQDRLLLKSVQNDLSILNKINAKEIEEEQKNQYSIRINGKSRKILENNKNKYQVDMWERNQRFIKERDDNLIQMKIKLEQELEQKCPFKPNISKKQQKKGFRLKPDKTFSIDKIPIYDPSNISNYLLKSQQTNKNSNNQSFSKIDNQQTKKKMLEQKSYSLLKKQKESQKKQLKSMRTATSYKIRQNLMNRCKETSIDTNIVTIDSTKDKQEMIFESISKNHRKSLNNFRNRVQFKVESKEKKEIQEPFGCQKLMELADEENQDYIYKYYKQTFKEIETNYVRRKQNLPLDQLLLRNKQQKDHQQGGVNNNNSF